MSVAESVFIHPSSYVDDGAVVGEETKIWHYCHIMPKASVGSHCSIGQNVFIANNVVLKNGVKVQNNVSLYDGVICDDDVFLGPSMVFTNVINPRSSVNRKNEYKTTLVKKGASIGANVTIVCGNTIGEYAFIGAGSVVTKDVPAYALMVGVPSRQIGWVSRNGLRLHFDEQGFGQCPETGDKYKLENNNVKFLSS